jgi:hypothetical protein
MKLTRLLLILASVVIVAAQVSAQTHPPELMLRMAETLVKKTHYLEALDVLNEARDHIEELGATQNSLYADLLHCMAQAKIMGRLHQGFPAFYVKTALEDIQAANKLRENLPGTLPQRLSEGYFLEGYIHWNYFRRRNQAMALYVRAISLDSGNSAAKRALSELITPDDLRQ